MISVTRLQIGDKFVGYTPMWAAGSTREMTVLDIREDVIKIKAYSDSGSWWPKKDVLVYEILNRKEEQDEERKTKYNKFTLLDIDTVSVGDRVLTTRPWCTDSVFEDVVTDIKEKLIKLDDEWRPKQSVLVIDILSHNNETPPDDAFCPFRSTGKEISPCDKRCRFFDCGCLWDRILTTIKAIEDNTSDED